MRQSVNNATGGASTYNNRDFEDQFDLPASGRK